MGSFSVEGTLILFAYYCQGPLSSSVIFLSKEKFRKPEGVYFTKDSLLPGVACSLFEKKNIHHFKILYKNIEVSFLQQR